MASGRHLVPNDVITVAAMMSELGRAARILQKHINHENVLSTNVHRMEWTVF